MTKADKINRRAALSRLLRQTAVLAIAPATTAWASGNLREVFDHVDDWPRGIHLGLTADPRTSMVLGWHTRDPLKGPCEVEIGLLGSDVVWVEQGQSITHPSLGTSQYHEVLIENLHPGTTYELMPRPGTPDAHSVIATTFDRWDGNLVVTAYGDHGTQRASEAVMLGAAAVDADFHLHLGDLSYANGRPSVWNQWFKLIEPLATDRPYLTMLGNHEVEAQWWGDACYRNRFHLPNNKFYYALRHDHLALIVIDSEHMGYAEGLTQRNWAQAELEAATADPRVSWIVVALHRPLYSSSYHGGNADLVRFLEPLLIEYDVDLVLAGHDHIYERSFPIIGGQPQTRERRSYVDINAPIHVTSGGGGDSLYGTGWSEFTAATARVYHYLRMEFVGRERLQVEAIAYDGERIDAFEIIKTE